MMLHELTNGSILTSMDVRMLARAEMTGYHNEQIAFTVVHNGQRRSFRRAVDIVEFAAHNQVMIGDLEVIVDDIGE